MLIKVKKWVKLPQSNCEAHKRFFTRSDKIFKQTTLKYSNILNMITFLKEL